MGCLGWLYEYGKGVGQDLKEAAEWYRKAAGENEHFAAYYLGWMYADGRGVARDDTEAARWFREAADEGNSKAMIALGCMHAAGRGLPQSNEEAIKWLRRASEKGDAQARTLLGTAYQHDGRVPGDSLEWFRRAQARRREKLETVVVVSDTATVKVGGDTVRTAPKGRMFGVIARDGDLFQIQVCEGTDIRRGWVHASHVKLLHDGDVDVAAEWLRATKLLKPDFDISTYRARLDALLERLCSAAAGGETPKERVRLVANQLLEHEGFAFKSETYGLDAVIDQKKANCLGLSLLNLCVAQKLGMPLELVSGDTHGFVRYDDGRELFDIETARCGVICATDSYLRSGWRSSVIHRYRLPIVRSLGVLLRSVAWSLGQSGKYAQSQETYAKCVEMNPEYYPGYAQWGGWLAKAGHHAEACEMHAKSISIEPGYVEGYVNWGTSLIHMGKEAEACEKFAKATAIDPAHADTYYGWGLVLQRMGKYAEACQMYSKSVAIDPQNVNAHCSWARELRRLGRLADAVEKYEKASEINPRHASAYRGWGFTLRRMGKYREACQKYAKATEIDPQNAGAYYAWGSTLWELGDHAGAAEKYQKAVEINPEYTLAYRSWGFLLLRMGKWGEATAKLRKAIEHSCEFRVWLKYTIRDARGRGYVPLLAIPTASALFFLVYEWRRRRRAKGARNH